ncbi:MAG: exopolysaccharide Pel transporter PelG, partial [Rhizorhabdus sp.]
MAGIGFQLAKTAREGGVGGIVGAAAFGAIISAGPWLITAIAMALLDGWTLRHLGSEGGRVVQTVLVYAFSLSALAAAPIGILATRMAADRIFARDAAGVTGIVIVALAAGGALALAVGALVFGLLAGLPLLQATIATIILAWLTQIWIAAPLLTALRRYRAVPLAYLFGIAFAAIALLLIPHPGITQALAVIAAGIGLTLAAIVWVIRGHFATIATLPPRHAIAPQLARIVAAAGVAAGGGMWVDKLGLWVGPHSIAAGGLVRGNPNKQQGSLL